MQRIQILNPGNDHVKNGKEEGTLALIAGPEFISYLPLPFVCMPKSYRPKGLKVSKTDPNDIVEFYDVETVKQIIGQSHTKTHYWYYGPEFIVTHDGQDSTLYFCTETLRPLAIQLKTKLGKPVIMNLIRQDAGHFHFYLPEFI